jgi:S-adenosylmethionine:tRNA ribosyltransferase-isomerase
LEQRDASKLLVYRDGKIEDQSFSNLPDLLPDNTQLIFNNTRVVKARLHFTKTSGAKPIEVFCLGPYQMSVEDSMNATRSIQFECLVGNLKRWKDHALHLELGHGLVLTAEKGIRIGHAFVIHFSWNSEAAFSTVLEIAGKIPLPPYMNRDAENTDVERYQTVYAASNGSVAAPTAGLHFTQKVFDQLTAQNHQWFEVTLHVGAGTFKPLDNGAVDKHEMHSEELLLSRDLLERYLAHKGTKFAVGTTSLRTLESCHWMGVKILQGQLLEDLGQFEAYSLNSSFSTEEAYSALLDYLNTHDIQSTTLKTQLMIKPGYRIKTVKGIITNFHQPGSTLLLLVSAGIGKRWQEVYQHALAEDYRFLSYGDSSLLYFD